jgi:hypothetical protein
MPTSQGYAPEVRDRAIRIGMRPLTRDPGRRAAACEARTRGCRRTSWAPDSRGPLFGGGSKPPAPRSPGSQPSRIPEQPLIAPLPARRSATGAGKSSRLPHARSAGSASHPAIRTPAITRCLAERTSLPPDFILRRSDANEPPRPLQLLRQTWVAPSACRHPTPTRRRRMLRTTSTSSLLRNGTRVELCHYGPVTPIAATSLRCSPDRVGGERERRHP